MADTDPSRHRFDAADFGLTLLAFAAGGMDALAFLNLREVFPSAMTGNTALLGVALGQGHLIAASRPLAAFAGFVAGAAAASGSVHLWLAKVPTSRAVSRLLAVEATLLAAFALACQFVTWPVGGNAAVYGLIFPAAAAMGMQSVAARLIGRAGIVTVVLTSTLTSIVGSLVAIMLRPGSALPLATGRQMVAFASYAVGAATAGLLAAHAATIAVLPGAAVLAAAACHRLAGEQAALAPQVPATPASR